MIGLEAQIAPNHSESLLLRSCWVVWRPLKVFKSFKI